MEKKIILDMLCLRYLWDTLLRCLKNICIYRQSSEKVTIVERGREASARGEDRDAGAASRALRRVDM